MDTATIDPFARENYEQLHIASTKDFLICLLNAIRSEAGVTLDDLSEEELHWEPLRPAARDLDSARPPEEKKVWRVFHNGVHWTYDYADGELQPPPFTTIGWIMNHIVVTAEMYLYCIESGKAAGEGLTWDDIPVSYELTPLRDAVYGVLDQTLALLESFTPEALDAFLNRSTPSPWGEWRPTVLNLLGGVLQHALQHLTQIAARKEQIRFWSSPPIAEA